MAMKQISSHPDREQEMTRGATTRSASLPDSGSGRLSLVSPLRDETPARSTSVENLYEKSVLEGIGWQAVSTTSGGQINEDRHER